MHSLLLAVAILAGARTAPAAQSGLPAIHLTADGKDAPILDEDTGRLEDRPLVKTKERLDAKHGHPFLFLEKVLAKPGTKLSGRYEVEGAPMRVTLYEIAKEKNADHRMLRVLGTRWCRPGETAAFEGEARDVEEQVFLITAERTKSAEELDSHLQYMNSQGDQLLVKGFGTNWKLTELKFKLSGKTPDRKEDDFSHDADWMAGRLIDPAWIVSLRVVAD